jgi:hypothetical protein
VYDHDNLRLRRIRYREAEEKHETEQNLFHNLVCRPGKSNYRATMTTACNHPAALERRRPPACRRNPI